MGRTTAAGSVGLARSGAHEQATAWHHREALIASAAALVAAAGHDQDGAGCDEAGCGLADATVCGIAHRLARLPGAPAIVPALPREVATDRFASALTAAADAIRHCRQTVHAGRDCWFSDDPGRDDCGAVLRLLHRLG